jgi:putative ABC transport system permease protein
MSGLHRFGDQVAQDVRYAWRGLLARPAFTAIAVLTIAAGVGANTAIYSVVDAALLRPLPFPEPDRLMALSLRMPMPNGAPPRDMIWSYPKYEHFAGAQTAFTAHAVHSPRALTLATDDGAERVPGEVVGGRYFEVLGLPPLRGRLFDATDDVRGGEARAVISEGYWRRQFGSGDVLGRSLTIGGRPYVIVGVAPRGFRGLSGTADVWVPLTAFFSEQNLAQATAHNLQLVARRRGDVPVSSARAELVRLGRQIDDVYPDPDGDWGAAAYALDELRIDPALRSAVVVLAVAVGLVLLIACANIASLLLARGAARRREMAVRLAVGANRGRLFRQMLTESLMLASLGAVAATFVAALGVSFLSIRVASMAPALTGMFGESAGLTNVTLPTIGLDARMLAFAVIVALATGVLFGFGPALTASRTPMSDVLRSGAVATPAFAGLRRLTGRGVLVASEIALATTLLIVSGLMIQSLDRLFRARVGYDPSSLLTTRLTLSPTRAPRDSTLQLWADLAERLRAIPAVTAVGVASCAPVGDNCEGTSINIGGQPQGVHVALHAVSPGFFQTMRAPLLRGRAFSDSDRRGAPGVMIINEAAARAYWGAADPLETPVQWSGAEWRVVGIVSDIRYEAIDQPAQPAAYFPYGQFRRVTGTVFVRTSGDPASVIPAMRREIRAADREHAFSDVRPMTSLLRDATARTRITTVLLGSFSAIALLLAGLGIYGVLALAVAQRTRELGVRVALGARRESVMGLVMRQALALAVLGGGLGLLLAVATTRGLGALLYETRPLEPSAYASAVAVLVVATIAAAGAPAWRATKVSPTEALRQE